MNIRRECRANEKKYFHEKCESNQLASIASQTMKQLETAHKIKKKPAPKTRQRLSKICELKCFRRACCEQ
jgi:pyridoxine/pyridoxamine 5'-phosphate oxidase